MCGHEIPRSEVRMPKNLRSQISVDISCLVSQNLSVDETVIRPRLLAWPRLLDGPVC